MQTPSQAVSQQYPSTQFPLEHWDLLPQAVPFWYFAAVVVDAVPPTVEAGVPPDIDAVVPPEKLVPPVALGPPPLSGISALEVPLHAGTPPSTTAELAVAPPDGVLAPLPVPPELGELPSAAVDEELEGSPLARDVAVAAPELACALLRVPPASLARPLDSLIAVPFALPALPPFGSAFVPSLRSGESINNEQPVASSVPSSSTCRVCLIARFIVRSFVRICFSEKPRPASRPGLERFESLRQQVGSLSLASCTVESRRGTW